MPAHRLTDEQKERSRQRRIWAQKLKRYGVTKKRWDAIMAAQGGRCPGCLRVLADLPQGQQHIDHDHRCCGTASDTTPACGRCVRGILCQSCNTALGMVRDNVQTLFGLIFHLENKDRK